jgi:predicted DNA-binding transcriptional regulator YafY
MNAQIKICMRGSRNPLLKPALYEQIHDIECHVFSGDKNMQASRLLSILLLLQSRGRMSAAALARHFEVSVRTIHRDIDQLSAANIPIYGGRGRAGGFQLMDGFQTKLTGLTQTEAETLLLAGLPGPVEELGLSDQFAMANLKLLASLPPGMRAERVAARFHLDAAAWFHTTERAEHLQSIAQAVWGERVLRIQYRRAGEVGTREIQPLGLVLKSGVWYLVALRAGRPVTYRAGNIVAAEILDQAFDRPASFDLAAYWTAAARDFETGVFRDIAAIRLSRKGREMLALLGAHAVAMADATAGPPDAAGWVRCDIPIEPIEYGIADLLRLGEEVEVLGPPELREAMRMVLQRITRFYA